MKIIPHDDPVKLKSEVNVLKLLRLIRLTKLTTISMQCYAEAAYLVDIERTLEKKYNCRLETRNELKRKKKNSTR
jgi:hypothetical protein